MLAEQVDVEALEREIAETPSDLEHVPRKVDLLNRLAYGYLELQRWKKAHAASEQAAGLAATGPYVKGLARALRNLGFSRYIGAEHAQALKDALESLRLFQGLADREGEADALTVVALVRWTLGNYDQALKEGLRALKIYTEIGDRKGQAWCYTSLGAIYQTIGDSNQALQYQTKARAMFQELRSLVGEGRSLSGIGTVFQALGQHDQALEYHQQALELYRSADNRLGESRALNDIGVIYQERGDLERALECHRRSLEIRREDGTRQAEITSLLNLARVRLAQDQVEEAAQFLEEALRVAEEIGATPKTYQAHELLSRAYERRGDYRAALHHQRAFQESKEAVFNEEQSTRLRNLQISYETEKSQKEAEMFRMVNEGLRAKNEQLAKLLGELQAAQAQLVHTEKLAGLGDLVAGLAHELNSPVGAIHSASDVTAICVERILDLLGRAETVDDLRQDQRLERLLRTLKESSATTIEASRRISRTVRSLKSFAHLDEAEYQLADLEQGVENTLTLLEPKLDNRIGVVRQYGGLPKVYCYAADLNQVFMNLLTNAIQAIDDRGTITICTRAEQARLFLAFSDTGRGIPAERMARLFHPRFQKHGARVRASMSLFACFNIVRKHHGEIRVESEAGQGTTFTIELPRSLERNLLEA